MGGLRYSFIQMHKQLGRNNIPRMLRNFSNRSAPWVPAPPTFTSTPPFKFRPGLLIAGGVLASATGFGFLYRTKYGRPLSLEEHERYLNELIANRNELKEGMLKLHTSYDKLQTTFAHLNNKLEEYIAIEQARIAEMKAEQLKAQVSGSNLLESNMSQDDV